MEFIISERRGAWCYWAAVVLSVLLHGVLWLTADALMTPDGFVYVRLADQMFQPQWLDHWDYQRTPLYPLLLKISFGTMGKSAQSATLPGVLLGLGGVLLTGFSVRRVCNAAAGAAVIIVLTVFPMMMTYEHAILTESGTFCILAAIVWSLLWTTESAWLRTMALSGILAIGYFHRATIVYLAPMCAFVIVLHLAKTKSWKTVFGHALIIVLVPFAASKIWNHGDRALKISDRFGYAIVHFLAKQAVIPPGDPILGPADKDYATAIAQVSNPGFDASGLVYSPESIRVWTELQRHSSRGLPLLWTMATQNPMRYAKAAARSTLLFAGAPSRFSENDALMDNFLSGDSERQFMGEPSQREVFEENFRGTESFGGLVRPADALRPVYRLWIILGTAVTLAAFAIGILKRDLLLVTLSVIPIAYAAMHIVLVFGLDRYAFPVFPLLIVNTIAIPTIFIRRRKQRAAATPPDQAESIKP